MYMFMKRVSMFTFVFLFALNFFPAGLCTALAQDAVPVSTVKVRVHSLETELDLKGEIRAFAEITVYSKVNGVIEKLLVEKADMVKRGDIIAIVEHRSELAQRKELLAVVESAKVAIRQAESAVRVAEASLSQAEAQLENAILEKTRAECPDSVMMLLLPNIRWPWPEKNLLKLILLLLKKLCSNQRLDLPGQLRHLNNLMSALQISP